MPRKPQQLPAQNTLPYQEEALREICGQCVMLQSIDFQQFERSVLYS